MTFSKKLVAVAVAAAAAVFTAAAAADHGGRDDGGHHHGRNVLTARLVGSLPNDPAIHGVLAGGVPWEGGARATLNGRGRFELRVRDSSSRTRGIQAR